jgi:uncharacterized membrane-anchored protein YjiN (DUF445 family)
MTLRREERFTRRVFDAIEAILHDVSDDPAHPLHQRFNTTTRRFVEDLQSNSEVIAMGEVLKDELLQRPIVRDLAASLWMKRGSSPRRWRSRSPARP